MSVNRRLWPGARGRTAGASTKALTVAVALAVLSSAIHASYALNALFPRGVLDRGGIVNFAGAVVLSGLQSVAVFFLLIHLPRVVRIVLAPVLLLIVLTQLTYWRTVGTYMLSTDWFLALTVGSDHVGGAIVSFFDPTALLYACPYAVLLGWIACRPSMPWSRRSVLAVVSAALFLAASNYVFYQRVNEKQFVADPVTNFIRSGSNYELRKWAEYHGPRDEVPAIASAVRPKRSVIYVIDESIRGSNLSLNGYPRDTTPYLRSLAAAGRLENLGICAASSVYSHVSNAYLISGASEMPDTAMRTAKNPTLFDFAKAAGYETVFIDVNEAWLSTHTDEQGAKTIRSVDHWLRYPWFMASGIDLANRRDLAVADVMSDFLNHGDGVFMVVVKKGLHFHYRNRFPDDPKYETWTPVMQTSDPIDPSPTGREKLVNTYDDGLRYQVDEFFREFVALSKNQNYVVVYTSDHGQTLSENGQRYTHAMPDEVIADVPCFFVHGASFDKLNVLEAVKPGIRVSHLNLFATVLDLLEVPDSARLRTYPKSVFDLTPDDNKIRPYLTGSLNGDSHGLGSSFSIRTITDPPKPGWGISRPPPSPGRN